MEPQAKPPRSERFRYSHDELLELMGAMSRQLVPSDLQRDATAARSLLSMLAGKLTIHLAMEDALYPKLVTHRDQAVRQLSEQLRMEMGGLCSAFKLYVRRWPTAESIQIDAVSFVRETEKIFLALRNRIVREDEQLFRRLDEL